MARGRAHLPADNNLLDLGRLGLAAVGSGRRGRRVGLVLGQLEAHGRRCNVLGKQPRQRGLRGHIVHDQHAVAVQLIAHAARSERVRRVALVGLERGGRGGGEEEAKVDKMREVRNLLCTNEH